LVNLQLLIVVKVADFVAEISRENLCRDKNLIKFGRRRQQL